jgi:TolB-like protein
VQVFSEIFPALDIPASAIRYIWLGALIGLPIAIVFGWLYDVTTAGIVRTAPANIGADVDLGLRKADYAILAALAVAASTVVVQLGGRVSNQGTMADVPATEATVLPSIGVLPLENLSADPGQEYFANGLHDALIADLSRISGLRVTSKMSARAYANTTKPIETVCSELAISKVITGNLLRVEDNLTVNVELKDCDDDELLWSSAYSRKLSDVLIIQSEITRSVADAVEVALTRQETELLARTRTVNPAAYESYLRGMFHLEMITPKDMQLAEDLFTRALEFDRNSALAHWGLGRACRFQMQFGMGMPQERDPECRGHQFRALAIDPEAPRAGVELLAVRLRLGSRRHVVSAGARAEPELCRSLHVLLAFPGAAVALGGERTEHSAGNRTRSAQSFRTRPARRPAASFQARRRGCRNDQPNPP